MNKVAKLLIKKILDASALSFSGYASRKPAARKNGEATSNSCQFYWVLPPSNTQSNNKIEAVERHRDIYIV